MTKVKNFVKASIAFVRCLFRANAKTRGFSENGHSILEGWNKSPEEEIIKKALYDSKSSGLGAKYSLYCYSGPHEGEMFFLSRTTETLGKGLDNTIIVSPGNGPDPKKYRAFVNGQLTLSAESGEYFKLNGLETQKADLFDFDEIEMLGNKFLMLDFSNFAKDTLVPLQEGMGGEK